MLYQVLMTVASFEIVKEIPEDVYGLIFGINTFYALGLQTILTLVVNTALSIEPQLQFQIYACLYLGIALGYALLVIYSKFAKSKDTT